MRFIRVLLTAAVCALSIAACSGSSPAALPPSALSNSNTQAPDSPEATSPVDSIVIRSPNAKTVETVTAKPITADVLNEIASLVQENLERFKVPGAAVAIVQNGEVVFARGFGVKELGSDDPVTPDTLFSLGSVTKPMTSTMVATLVDDGLLDWDAPVVEIMPQLRLSDPQITQQITLRHIFAHTTGLPSTRLSLGLSGVSPTELVEFLADVPSFAQPGEERLYQSQVFAIGGFIAAWAAGAQYGQGMLEGYFVLMSERLFNPIGMATATFSTDEVMASPDHATPHFITLNGTVEASGFDIATTEYRKLSSSAPAGAAKASVMDVAGYLATVLGRGLAPDGTRVVTAANLAETTKQNIGVWPESIADKAGAGLGWSLETYQGISTILHDGGAGGFSTSMTAIPDADTGIVVLTNVDVLGAFLARSVQLRLVELLYGLEPRVDAAVQAEFEEFAELSRFYRRLEAVDPEAVKPYLGEYQGAGYSYKVELRDGKLWVSRGQSDLVQLLSAPFGTYLAISPGGLMMTPFKFFEDAEGNVTLLIEEEVRAPKIVSPR